MYGVPMNLWNACRYDKVKFAEEILGLHLHDGQKEFLRHAVDRKFFLLDPSNQWGKSFTIAILLIWCAVYKFNQAGWDYDVTPVGFEDMPYLPIYLTPKLRQARSVYTYILQFLTSKFFWTEEVIYDRRNPTDYRKKTEINKLRHYSSKCLLTGLLQNPRKVPNTQQISTTPVELTGNREINILSTLTDQGASTAGAQFPIIIYDECCLDNHLQETVGNYLYSRSLKFQAPIILVSTPDQASESYTYFLQLAQDSEDDSDWYHMSGVLTDNRFYTRDQIAKEKERLKKLDPDVYRQVFYGDYVAGRGTFFKPSTIERIFSKENEFTEALPKHQYVMGADFASSQSYTVFVVLDITDKERWDLVKLWRCKGIEYSPDYQLEVLIDLSREYNNARVGIDASSLAGPLLESRLHSLDVYANNFSGINKKELLLALKKALTWNDKGKIRAPWPGSDKQLQALKRELHTYVEKDRGKVKDCVMSLGLAAWVMYQDDLIGDYKPFEMDVFEESEINRPLDVFNDNEEPYGESIF